MKAVILAGGLGTRISEETDQRPKPMVEIGGRPILWHIMKTYAHHGVSEFIVCCGYKGYVIKEYFANYFLHQSDVTIDLGSNKMEVHQNSAEPWRITLVDTGVDTMTGGRLRRVRKYLNDEDFCFTYGDGLSNTDITASIHFHKTQGSLVTLTGVQPPGRFGSLEIMNDKVTSFKEKPRGDGLWVNGGYFVVSPAAIDAIEADETVWEREPLEAIAQQGLLSVYRHPGFWHPMDTLRDKRHLEELWQSGMAPWKIWS